MRLKELREHYQSNNFGKTWIPKLSFESIESIKEHGFNLNKWNPYECTFCGKYHVAKIIKTKDEYAN